MRFLVRLIGVVVFAAAFVMVVIDGTRSIAADRLLMSSLADAIGLVWPDAVPGLSVMLSSVHEALWDPAGQWLFNQPAFAVLGILGLVLLFIGRTGREVVRPLRRRQ